METVTTYGPEETFRQPERLGKASRPGQVYCLQGDVEEMEEIGYEDCFYGDGVSLVEWPDLVREILPEDAVWIWIEKDLAQGFDCRQIRIGVKGDGI